MGDREDGAEPVFIGVDAGGTTTRALAVNGGGRVLGVGRRSGANPRSAGPDAGAQLTAALREAVAGLPAQRVRGGVVGMAGGGAPPLSKAADQVARAWTAAGLPGRPTLTQDVAVAFAAGSDTPHGCVLTAGTGAVAARMSDWQVQARADGYGWLVGDEGSGVWLGLAGVRAALRALDGRAADTSLLGAVAEALDALPVDAGAGQRMLRAVEDRPPARLGGLATVVCAQAAAGDAVAGRLVDEAVAHLLASLAAVADDPPVIVLAGGLVAPSAAVGRRVRLAVARRWPAARVTVVASGEAGAAVLALRAAGITVDAGVRTRLARGVALGPP